MTQSDFWSLHTHSLYSKYDALPSVHDLVDRAVELGYPALGLTDHGTMTGVPDFYLACRKAGIEPLPGVELYLTSDRWTKDRKNYHLIVAAYTPEGYLNLAKMVTMTNKNHYYKPVIDFADLAELYEQGLTKGLLVSTSCVSGVVIKTLEAHGVKAATTVVEALATWFPKAYVEIQSHRHQIDGGWPEEDIIQGCLDVANAAGVPFIVAQDSHYVFSNDRDDHDLVKMLMSWSEDADDARFTGDGYHMVGTNWMRQHHAPYLDQALDSLAELAKETYVRIPDLERFNLKVPDVTFGQDQDEVLFQKVTKGLEDKPLSVGKTVTQKRLTEELRVIKTAEMAGLILVVNEVCEFMRREKIWYSARGSASGSLVTYALDITQLDPFKYDLMFERFLSKDRTRPPDIDLDIEHERRSEVARMISSRWPAVQIGTLRYLGLSDDTEQEDSRKGSLFQKYCTLQRKMGKHPPGTWADLSAKEKQDLERLEGRNLFDGHGTHPAGWVIARHEDDLKWLPMVRIKTEDSNMVTAYGSKTVEAFGFLKLDALGVKDLTAMRIACEVAEVTLDDIPLRDAKVFDRICAGETTGVFQLQGASMRKGCKSLKPRTIEELALVNALFRPAARSSKADTTLLLRRDKRQEVPDMHDDISTVTASTYGVIVYQEQVMQILGRLGMSSDELTSLLGAVKASNKHVEKAAATIAQSLETIERLSVQRGWTEQDIAFMEIALKAYADYGFNKAHAVAYAIKGFQSAWLAVHHPQAFWLGQLTVFGESPDKYKRRMILSGARASGLRINSPHINKSKENFSLDGPNIRKGLLAIKGVGPVVAQELVKHQPYSSVMDLAMKVNPSVVTGAKGYVLGKTPEEAGGIIKALYEAELLHGLLLDEASEHGTQPQSTGGTSTERST